MMNVFTLPQWQRRNVIELGIWTAIYLAMALPMALGQSNGIGYFQQPQGHSLWAPLVLGGAVNIWIIYLHAYQAMPHLLVRGSRLKYLPTVVAVVGAYFIAHTLYQLALAWTIEPSLRSVSLGDWAQENLMALPIVILFSVIYRFARDWVALMPGHHALVDKTKKLEQEFQLVKEELVGLKNSNVQDALLKIESGREKIQLPVQSIRYLKAAGNYVEVNTVDKAYTVYGSLGDFLARLPVQNFCRIHRSYIVNLDRVTSMATRELEVGTQKLPISATYKRALIEQWDADKD